MGERRHITCNTTVPHFTTLLPPPHSPRPTTESPFWAPIPCATRNRARRRISSPSSSLLHLEMRVPLHHRGTTKQQQKQSCCNNGQVCFSPFSRYWDKLTCCGNQKVFPSVCPPRLLGAPLAPCVSIRDEYRIQCSHIFRYPDIVSLRFSLWGRKAFAGRKCQFFPFPLYYASSSPPPPPSFAHTRGREKLGTFCRHSPRRTCSDN